MNTEKKSTSEIKVMTFQELIESGDRQEKEEREAVIDRGLALIKPDTLEIVLDGWYHVDLERITNPKDLVNWIVHLREKNWFTPQIMSDMFYWLGDMRGRTLPWNWEGFQKNDNLYKVWEERGYRKPPYYDSSPSI